MQSEIRSFFKPPSPRSSPKSTVAPPTILDDDGDDELAIWQNTHHQFVNTYKRRPTKPKSFDGEKENESNRAVTDTLTKPNSGKVLNKKRSYAQFHLDFGQSDFNLRTCSICGVKYAPGDENDEKTHKAFHKNYTYGIQFKVLRSERIVHMPCTGRIVLVLDVDPPSLRNKVQEVINMMEIELGGGWIFHKLCKVYLFISSSRVAGCLIAEPIQEAFKILSCSMDEKSDCATKKDSRPNRNTLRFGEIILQRETAKKVRSVNSLERLDGNCNGTIVCEEEAVPAICGIRAIWVTPSNRRKHIANQLLDAVRRSFCMGFALEKSQLAFSPPTSAGKALACSFFGTTSFLVYKPNTAEGYIRI